MISLFPAMSAARAQLPPPAIVLLLFAAWRRKTVRDETHLSSGSTDSRILCSRVLDYFLLGENEPLG